MGYSYLYPKYQTADYTIKFIHNDFLGQALDTGIISMALLVFLFISNILNKNSSSLKKQILTIMLLHMMLEFDMQFLAIQFILVALLEETKSEDVVYKLARVKIASTIVATVFIGVFTYYTIATYADKRGNYELTLELLPNKTSANVQKLLSIEKLEESEKLATQIIKQNPYVAVAYKVKANYAYITEQWEQMVENQKKAIALSKYDIQEYENYIFLISNSLEQTVRNGKEHETSYLIAEALNVTVILDETKNNTNILAYQTYDNPNLELTTYIKQYLDSLKIYKNEGG